MKIMVLGGSGFVGMNLLKMLDSSQLNHDVLDFSRSLGYDLADDASEAAILDFGPEVIINLASHGGSLHYVTEFAADVISDNINISLNLYDVARKMTQLSGNPLFTPFVDIGRDDPVSVAERRDGPVIINAISNCSYPGNTQIQKESDWLSGPVHDSVFSFANSKRVLYYISKCYNMQYGVESINLIFPNAFGTNDHTDPNKTHAMDGIIIRMIGAKRAGDPQFEVWGTGSPIREWIFVEDFCKILMTACNYEPIIEPINVAQGRGYSIKESVEIVKELTGYEGEIVFNTDYQDGDPVKVLDDSNFRSLFSSYKFIDHKEALSRTIQYYEEALK